MKQIIAAFFLCMLLWPVSGLRAQNIQLHYDFCSFPMYAAFCRTGIAGTKHSVTL